MMRMRNKATESTSLNGSSAAAAENEWEVRPGGMLVQKRDPDAEINRIPPPTIRVRVKHGSIYHEVNIGSQATFGELKKLLTAPTGLHHEDQKLVFKDKERDSKTYLDVVGVKDRSKMVVMEDPISQERRFVEMRKNAKMEKAAKSISGISLEVDRLSGQVSGFESVISKGGKVAEKSLLNLIELLMNQLLKLDGIVGDGDVKLQRKMQVKRVQKLVETLDVLKLKNSMPSHNDDMNGNNHVAEQRPPPIPRNQGRGGTTTASHHHYPPPPPQSRRTFGAPQHQPPPKDSTSGGVMMTTQWETFDNNSNSNNNNSTHPKFNWDLL